MVYTRQASTFLHSCRKSIAAPHYFFSISAGEIIFNGTTQRLVCKGRDDQRGHFWNNKNNVTWQFIN